MNFIPLDPFRLGLFAENIFHNICSCASQVRPGIRHPVSGCRAVRARGRAASLSDLLAGLLPDTAVPNRLGSPPARAHHFPQCTGTRWHWWFLLISRECAVSAETHDPPGTAATPSPTEHQTLTVRAGGHRGSQRQCVSPHPGNPAAATIVWLWQLLHRQFCCILNF